MQFGGIWQYQQINFNNDIIRYMYINMPYFYKSNMICCSKLMMHGTSSDDGEKVCLLELRWK